VHSGIFCGTLFLHQYCSAQLWTHSRKELTAAWKIEDIFKLSEFICLCAHLCGMLSRV